MSFLVPFLVGHSALKYVNLCIFSNTEKYWDYFRLILISASLFPHAHRGTFCSIQPWILALGPQSDKEQKNQPLEGRILLWEAAVVSMLLILFPTAHLAPSAITLLARISEANSSAPWSYSVINPSFSLGGIGKSPSMRGSIAPHNQNEEKPSQMGQERQVLRTVLLANSMWNVLHIINFISIPCWKGLRERPSQLILLVPGLPKIFLPIWSGYKKISLKAKSITST